jgi:hypothetical protein
MQEPTLHGISFWGRDRLLKDKLMLQGFLQSSLILAFRKIYGRYNDSIYHYMYKLSLNHCLTFYKKMLDCTWLTNFDPGKLRIHDYKTGLAASVTSLQGMFIPPRHLIPSPVYLGICACSFVL